MRQITRCTKDHDVAWLWHRTCRQSFAQRIRFRLISRAIHCLAKLFVFYAIKHRECQPRQPPRSDTELYNYLGVSRRATAALLRSFGRQTTLGYGASRFPFSQIFPSACFNDETAFSCKWPHNRKLAIQACAERMELCRCLWWFSPRNDFGRVHFLSDW